MTKGKLFDLQSKYVAAPIFETDLGQEFNIDDYNNLENSLLECVSANTLTIVLCENTIEPLSSLLVLLNNFRTVMLLDAQIRKNDLDKIIEGYKPNYLFSPKAKDFTQNYKTRLEFADFHLLETNYTERIVSKYNPILLLSTSGSTGSQKFVAISDQNILSNAKSIKEYLCLSQLEKPITSLPAHYSYGFSVLSSHLSVGATIVVSNHSMVEKQFWSSFKKLSCTSFAGVPYTYELLNKLKFDAMDLPSLRTLTQAGGRLSPELTEKFEKIGLKKNYKFYVMYGQTEATARISYVPPEKLEKKIGSIGVAIPDGKIWLENDLGEKIDEPHVIGELIYQGDNVSLGYVTDRDSIEKLTPRNRLNTGDLAYRDEDGFYFTAGRKNRILKLYGLRLSLDEIEDIMQKEFPETVCSGTDYELQIFTTSESDLDSIQDFASLHLRLPRSAIKISKIVEIPRNANGKIRYSSLKDQN